MPITFAELDVQALQTMFSTQSNSTFLTDFYDGSSAVDSLKVTTRPDQIIGSRGDESLVGVRGSDTMLGMQGDDIVRGGNGRDVLSGVLDLMKFMGGLG